MSKCLKYAEPVWNMAYCFDDIEEELERDEGTRLATATSEELKTTEKLTISKKLAEPIWNMAYCFDDIDDFEGESDEETKYLSSSNMKLNVGNSKLLASGPEQIKQNVLVSKTRRPSFEGTECTELVEPGCFDWNVSIATL
jgi:hypothetical protein